MDTRVTFTCHQTPNSLYYTYLLSMCQQDFQTSIQFVRLQPRCHLYQLLVSCHWDQYQSDSGMKAQSTSRQQHPDRILYHNPRICWYDLVTGMTHIPNKKPPRPDIHAAAAVHTVIFCFCWWSKRRGCRSLYDEAKDDWRLRRGRKNRNRGVAVVRILAR